jgi:hypothetical protein
MNHDICPTNLVTDAPSDSDAFGAHGRIAQAIAQLVRNSPGGKSVGLLGTWGAGKSTVVEILRQDLEGDQRFVVWLFDAWAHEGDSLRRMFLESLTERLRAKTWLDGKEWKERLEYLAGRRKVVEQSNTPRLSLLAVMLAVSLLLVPLGLELWSKRLEAGLAIDPALPVDWGAVLAVVSALAPLFVFVGYIVWLLIRGTSLVDVRGKVADALTLFVRQTDTASRTETLDSGEPTSLEFERLFCDVMEAALTPPAVQPDPDRRLVLVIDNLDRVGPEQGLAVWSTLQTFVRQREGHEPWLNRLWCLLPFDGNAIRRLWPQEASAGSLADSFLDKTFQVRFEVPLPLLSDWKDFMTARLKEAMPSHTDDDFFRVYRLYTVRRTMGTPSPTPRELKLFVNQVGSLHRQWQDEIPLPDLAYYALLRRESADIDSQSIASYPSPGEAGLVSDGVRQHLAAMAYGVPIASAQELLLRDPIMRALEDGNSESLKALAEGNEAFALVFEQSLWNGCDEWPQAEGGKILHAVVALEGSEIAVKEKPARVEQWFARIKTAIDRVGTWAPMDDKAVDGILLLNERAPEIGPSMFQGFVSARTTAPPWGQPSAMPAFVSDYIRLESGLAHSVSNLGVTLPEDPTAFGLFAAELVTRDPEGRLWANFNPQSVDLVAQHLFQTVQQSTAFGVDALATVRVLLASKRAITWKAFVDEADKNFRQTEGRETRLLAALHELGQAGGADSSLRQLVSTGQARNWLMKHHGEEATEFIGPWLYTIAAVDPELKQLMAEMPNRDPTKVVTSVLRAQLIDGAESIAMQLATAVIQMGRADVIFDVAARQPQARTLMYRALVELAKMGPPARVFPPQQLLDRWTVSFGSDYDVSSIGVLLAEHGSPIASALAQQQSFMPDQGSFYAKVLDATREDASALTAYCASWLQGLRSGVWERSLASDAGLGQLTASLVRRGVHVTLGADVAAALTALAPKLALSALPPQGDPGRKAAIDALGPAARTGVLNAILDDLPMASQVNLPRLFALTDPSVLGSPWFEAHTDALAVGAMHIFKTADEAWLPALSRAIINHAQALSQVPDELKRDLAAAFEKLEPSKSTEVSATIEELRSGLLMAGVRLTKVDGGAPA